MNINMLLRSHKIETEHVMKGGSILVEHPFGCFAGTTQRYSGLPALCAMWDNASMYVKLSNNPLSRVTADLLAKVHEEQRKSYTLQSIPTTRTYATTKANPRTQLVV